MSKPKLEYRMYGLVPYNISPIQQGIQFGHAVVEYALEYGTDETYKKWAEEDKTFIILNGGTTNNKLGKLGTLNINAQKITGYVNGKFGLFCEPDLGDQLTAIVFLVEERVWDKEKYPDLHELPKWPREEWEIDVIKNLNKKLLSDMGGQDIWEFRQFLSQFRLA